MTPSNQNEPSPALALASGSALVPLNKYRVIYNASDDEHAPDWRDDGIFIMAPDATEAHRMAFESKFIKGYEVDVRLEPNGRDEPRGGQSHE